MISRTSLSMPGPLARALAQQRHSIESTLDDDARHREQRSIDSLAASGIAAHARRVGDAAPPFSLPDAAGNPVDLAAILAQGPAVLLWHRGSWCPYCMTTLAAYQHRLGDLRAANASLMAISPDPAERARETARNLGLEFTLLSDEHNHLAREFGIAFRAVPALLEPRARIAPLIEPADADHHDLPITATYILDPSATIRYAYLNPDHRQRAEPDEVLEALAAL